MTPAPVNSARPARPRWGVGELPLALVLAVVGVGLIVVAYHHFRVGSLLVAFAVLGAAVFRLVLPARRAGLLVIRGRVLDVTTLAVLGTALLALALAVPR